MRGAPPGTNVSGMMFTRFKSPIGAPVSMGVGIDRVNFFDSPKPKRFRKLKF